jgi:hypothetical protein
MPPPAGGGRLRTMLTVTATTVLEGLAEDLGAAAWLVAEDDPAHGYLVMLAALPPDPAAWREVLEPWGEDLRRGPDVDTSDGGRLAAAGAVGVAALRAARDLPLDEPLGAALRAAARWCFFLVRADVH